MIRILRFGLILCALLGLASCDDSYSWHQKLTVEVETPDGVIFGSSVQEAKLSETLHLGAGGKGAKFRLRGEAVVVEVAAGRHLFLLLPWDTNIAQYAVLDKATRRASLEARGKQMEQVGRKGAVPREHYPLLVAFDDITKPETVKQVDPDDLAATFGAGYALKSIMLEITNEAMTTERVEGVLEWVDNYQLENFRLNGKKCVACPISSENLADMIGPGNFKVNK